MDKRKKETLRPKADQEWRSKPATRSVFSGKARSAERDGLRLVWTELVFQGPVEKREARSRICIGIGVAVRALIPMECWPENAGRALPVWDEALWSLQLEQYAVDPTQG